MPEHLHLLVSEPERAALAQAIQSLKISSAKRSAASQARGEALWQPRGYDRNVRDYAEFKEKLFYIYRNPVRRGLCRPLWISC
jgi:putative transposase